MILSKRILLLLLALNAIWIRSIGQNQDTLVTITNKQAQFFIQQHLRAKSLMIDTLLLNKQIKALDGIIELKSGQLKNDSLMFIQKDKVAEIYKNSSIEFENKYNKSQKRLKFFKNTTVIFISTTTLLVGLFILVNK